MAILIVNGEIGDAELFWLEEYLSVVDEKLKKYSVDSQLNSGEMDAAEYWIGMGFIAMQRYMHGVITQFEYSKPKAILFPPYVFEGITYAEVINEGANYAKHEPEWWTKIINNESFKKNEMTTLTTILKITDWNAYTLSTVLATLVENRELKFSSLISKIQSWRDNLIKEFKAL